MTCSKCFQSVKGTVGAHRSPLKRSRGAKFEEEIVLAKRHNALLAEEISSLKDKILSVQQEIKATELCPDDYKDPRNTPQELQNVYSRLTKELESKSHTLAAKELEVNRKEEAIQAYKQAQKRGKDSKVCSPGLASSARVNLSLENSRIGAEKAPS